MAMPGFFIFMPKPERHLRIPAEQMQAEFCRILRKLGFPESQADKCAGIFTVNSLEGVYSHGVNRFAAFVGYIQATYPTRRGPRLGPSGRRAGAMEWQSGPGPVKRGICHGPRHGVGAGKRDRTGRPRQHQPLDAGRDLQLAGRPPRVCLDLLDQHLRQHAGLGRNRSAAGE